MNVHAVLDLNKEDNGNRRFIVVQLPEPCGEKSEAYKAGYKTIAEIGKERIRRVIAKITTENTGKEADLFSYSNESDLPPSTIQKMDPGFKVFKLDSTNIKPWDVNFDNLERTLDDYISNIKDDRSEHVEKVTESTGVFETRDYELPDIITYLQNETNLTRRTLVEILKTW